MLSAALALSAIRAVAQAVPEPSFQPIFANPVAFNSAPGERIRLGTLVPRGGDIGDLIALGVSFFVGKTEELGEPTEDALNTLLQGKAQANSQGLSFGLTLFTTFPPKANQSLVGDGVSDLISGSRVIAFSPWDIERVKWTAKNVGLVNRRLPGLQFLCLGIFGEFGDASFFTGQATQNEGLKRDWEAKLSFEPPPAGLWAGDSKAKESWSNRLKERYGSVEGAWSVWGGTPTIAELPMPSGSEFSYAARADFMDWYRDSIPALVTRLLSVTSEIMPSTPILVPFGPPSDQAYLGADAYLVGRAAKEKASAIKVTNLGFYGIAENWAMSLSRIRAASYANQLPLWTESPDLGDDATFNRRIFEALSLGTRGHIEWPQSLRARAADFERLSPLFNTTEPRCDVAILHPTTSQSLRPSQSAPPILYRSLVELRDYLDYDMLEESAISAGALARYRVAVAFEGVVWNGRTLSAIKKWVEEGGVLLAYDFGKMGDVFGKTDAYQEMFGFALGLSPAKIQDVWVGQLPSTYSVKLGGADDDELLQGRWSLGADGIRSASNDASLRLPARVADLVVTLQFAAGQSVKSIEIYLGNKQQAALSLEGGISKFQFPVPKTELTNGSFRVTFKGLEPKQAVKLLGVIVAETDVESEPVPLSGYFDQPLDTDLVRSAWSKPFGKGLVVYMPGKRDLWKAYINLVRLATYSLDLLEKGRASARNLDNKKDSVYITDLGNRAVAFNSGSEVVSLRAPFVEPISSQKTVLGSFDPAHFRVLLQCEEFRNLRGGIPEPVSGGLGVAIPANGFIETSFKVPRSGRYRVFARVFQDGALVVPRVKLNEIEPDKPNLSVGGVLWVGDIEVTAGTANLRISMPKNCLADFVLITSDKTVAGWRFGKEPSGLPTASLAVGCP